MVLLGKEFERGCMDWHEAYATNLEVQNIQDDSVVSDGMQVSTVVALRKSAL